jgi:hypothetical protein
MVLISTLEYLLMVLAAALLSSRGIQRGIRYGIGYVFTGLLLGMVVAYTTRDVIVVSLLAQGYLSLLGLMVLLDLRLPTRIVSQLRFLAGGLVGLELGVSPIGALLLKPAPALGFIVTAAGIYAIAGLFSAHCHAGWQRVTIRIAGSWIVAIAVIYLAYLVKQFR